MVYKKFRVNKVTLKRYWIMYCGKMAYTYKSNYSFVAFIQNSECFLRLNYLSESLKKVASVLFNFKGNTNYLMVGSNAYKRINRQSKLPVCKIKKPANLLSNFSVVASTSPKKALIGRPEIIFSVCKHTSSILYMAKLFNIPLVGLVTCNNNALLFEYPLFLNTASFYSVFFFNRFIHKLIC